MPFERRDVEAELEKKGFVPKEGDHSFFTYHTLAGRKTSVWTKTSRDSKYRTLGDPLVSAMAKQCGLTNDQFKRLIECSLSQQRMEQILTEIGRIKVT